MASRFSPVATRSSVTLALGITAPEASVTVPRTSVDVVWPRPAPVRQIQRIQAASPYFGMLNPPLRNSYGLEPFGGILYRFGADCQCRKTKNFISGSVTHKPGHSGGSIHSGAACCRE